MIVEKIFVSYARADGADFALRLSRDLKEKGYDVWIDQEDIRAGAEWDLEIEKALKTSDCVLFIETEKSITSPNVLDEVYYALEQRKKVIPLILVDGKTPFRLQRLQHINFSKSYESGLAHLINELERSDAAEAFPQETQPRGTTATSFFAQYTKPVAIVAAVLVLVAAIIFFTARNNTEVHASKSNETVDVNEFSGDWQLFDVEPKAKLTLGYLKIVDIDEEKVSIKSHLQFYYLQTNDTSFLSVFNAFAGCSSCVLRNDMKLTVEDVSIGSRTIRTIKEDQATGGKIGDTLMDAGSTKSIRAYATLQIIDNKNIVIEVKQPMAITLAHNLVLQPFVYLFRFKKNE